MKIYHFFSLRTAIILAFTCIPFLFATKKPPPDVSVASIEVNQNIQTTTNSSVLVAQRSTAVRATIGTAGASIPNVTGRLHVFVSGSEITPAAGLAPLAPITAVSAPDRNTENSTLNFEMLSPTNIPVSTAVTFRVDLSPVTGETNTGNNSMTTPNLRFVARTQPNLFFTRINYTPSGLGLPNLADVQPGSGDLFVRGIYPVNDVDGNLYRQGLFPTLTYSEDANGDGILAGFTSDGNDLLSLLASCRQLIVNNGLGAANNTFLYGWLAGNPIDGNGLGQIAGFNAFGNTQNVRFQRTYAHELGHNFGLDHNDITGHPQDLDGNVGWDVTARLLNHPAANGVTGRVKPSTFFDVMTAGQFTAAAWVNTTSFNELLANAAVGGTPSPDERKAQKRVAVVQGILSRKGDSLLYLKPIFRYPWASQGTNSRQKGVFTAVITDNAGAVSHVGFGGLVGDDGKNDKSVNHGFFEVMIPIDPAREISSVQIVDSKNNKRVLGRFKLSRPPAIKIVSPVTGDKLGKRTTVKWKVSDVDTPLKDLLFQIAYSSDGGRSWVPVAVDVKGTSYTFNSDEIRASDNAGQIRVFVSDGLNTVFDEVLRLQPTAAMYR